MRFHLTAGLLGPVFGAMLIGMLAWPSLQANQKETEKGTDKNKDTKSADKDKFAGKTVKDRKFGMSLIQERGKNVPKVGELAPDFALKTADGKQTVKLSSFRGKRPVVLVFGSFT